LSKDGAVLFFEISGFLFLKIFRLPLEICRPWTIFQYWMMYRDGNLDNFFISRLTHLAVPYDLSLAGLNQISVIWRPMPFLSLSAS